MLFVDIIPSFFFFVCVLLPLYIYLSLPFSHSVRALCVCTSMPRSLCPVIVSFDFVLVPLGSVMKLNFHNFIVRRQQQQHGCRQRERNGIGSMARAWRKENRKTANDDGLAPHQTQFYENALHNIAIGKLIKIYSSFWFFGNHTHCFVDHNLRPTEKTKCILRVRLCVCVRVCVLVWL